MHLPDPPARKFPRTWRPWPDPLATSRHINTLWDYVTAQQEHITRISEQLAHLETRMSSAESAAYARAAEVVGLIKAEFASLKTQLDSALVDRDAAVAAGVESALGTDADADANRITGLIDELVTVLPATVPDVPVPDPGVPAELPAEPTPADRTF